MFILISNYGYGIITSTVVELLIISELIALCKLIIYY